MNLSGKTYDINDIPLGFIDKYIRNLNFCPALTLNNIASSLAKTWAKEQKDERHHLATLKASSYEHVKYSLLGIHHYEKLEDMLDKLYKKLVHGSDIYYFRKRDGRSVERWLCDNFRGTMENPF